MNSYHAISRFYQEVREEVTGQRTFIGRHPYVIGIEKFPIGVDRLLIETDILFNIEDKPKEISASLRLGELIINENHALTRDIPAQYPPDAKHGAINMLMTVKFLTIESPQRLEMYVAVDGGEFVRSGYMRFENTTQIQPAD